MKTVGKQLQDARMAKGWSPEMAARETKIKVDRLHDLEADDFSNFSSPTYARGFVRTYARALGLDEYRILRQLDNKLPEDDNATFVNDTGVPYMPEPSQVSKPFEVGRGVYIAGGLGLATLLLIGFILVQSYRAGFFASSTPTPAAPTTNVAAAVPDTGPARAMPADSNAAPVPLPVDTQAPITSTSATPIDTNAAPRALPVDPAALAASSNAPAAIPVAPVAPADTNLASATQPAPEAVPPNAPTPVATPPDASAPAAAPANPAVAPASAHSTPATTIPATDSTATSVTPAPAPVSPPPAAPEAPVVATVPPAPAPGDSTASTVPTTTTTPPRALPVDLNALNSAPTANAPVADSTPAPAEERHPIHSLSARQANSRTSASAPGDDSSNQGTAAGPIIYPPDNTATQVASVQPAPSDTPPVVDSAPAPSSLGPASVTAPETGTSTPPPAPVASDSASALTGAPATGDPSSPAGASTSNSGDKFHGKRLVLTASHDSFIRVIALDGPNAGQVSYSSVLHGGQSISFNGRKYSINVGDPSAVDIALDGINYGPHSDNSAPDTFTVESHVP
jgi:cytoskeletal protein RodZ